jgi:hypothetical protein
MIACARPDLLLGDAQIVVHLAVGAVEARPQVVEDVHDDRQRVAQLMRDAGGELADRRHLLGLHQLRFEAALLRHVDADEQEPVSVSVVDRAGADVDRHVLAAGHEQVQVVAAGGASGDGVLP